jgi:K+-transporting ATPase ATPase A chain
MLLIPSALTYTFGSMLVRASGLGVFGTFLVMFIGFLALVYAPSKTATRC